MMDKGHYRDRRWESGSAFGGSAGGPDHHFRFSKSYARRDFREEIYSQGYPKGPYEREPSDRERHARNSSYDAWSQARTRDGILSKRDIERHEYIDYDDDYETTRRFNSDDFDRYGEYEVDRHRGRYGFEKTAWPEKNAKGFVDRGGITHRNHLFQTNREDGFERDHEFSRSVDTYSRNSQRKKSDEGDRRDREEHGKRSRSRSKDDREKGKEKRRRHDRSRSISRDEYSRSLSRSPSTYYRGRYGKEGSSEGSSHTRRRDREDLDNRKSNDSVSVAPSATIVVKGLSQRTAEDDLSHAMAKWGPLRHVRVIKERNTGLSRGFAFVDFPSTEAAQIMMDEVYKKDLVVDGRSLFLEYSSKPTGGFGGAPLGNSNSSGCSNNGGGKGPGLAVDWICSMCGCLNFARRIFCFQCNEGRTEDAVPADMSASYSLSGGKKTSEPGPTHVLVVRGLDENIEDETLHYEFSKHAPIKELRLIRDKFTHVSRGFAFVHFHSVDDATKVLEATNGITLDKHGQVLRVAYAKNVISGSSNSSGSSQASNLAAAAIEAAAFSQQYNSGGWAPKEFNQSNVTSQSDNKSITESSTCISTGPENTRTSLHTAPQSGFVWDETSGYYFDAASGFYYDGNSGLYYDGNNGVWYTYDHNSQQYTPYIEQSSDPQAASNKKDGKPQKEVEVAPQKEQSNPFSATETSVTDSNKKPSLPEAVHAAAVAAMTVSKRDKEKLKEKEREIKLASKNSLLASKKKMSNVLNMWKQRQNESQAPGSINSSPSVDVRGNISSTNTHNALDCKTVSETVRHHRSVTGGQSFSSNGVENPSGAAAFGVSDVESAHFPVNSGITTALISVDASNQTRMPHVSEINQNVGRGANSATSHHKTEAVSSGFSGSKTATKRRFSETPQTAYRDRAAERRNLYASTKPADNLLDIDLMETADTEVREMPYPQAVSRGPEFEVITSDKALDETNIGNKMLRNMGWQEGSGLGKDRCGIIEPVQAQSTGDRAGLGSQVQRRVDPRFEAQPGDSYKVTVQKKALARFHEMSNTQD